MAEIASCGYRRAQCLVAKQQPTGQLLDADRARALLPVRPHDGHKGTFGHVFVVAGSPGKAGAAMLASGAALRTGVGLCTLGTSGEIRAHLEGSIVDVMVEAIRGGASEIKRIEKLIVKSQRSSAVLAWAQVPPSLIWSPG